MMATPYVDILYTHYMNEDGTASVGGVQTYIRELSALVTELGANVRIFQFAKNAFSRQVTDRIIVEGIVTKSAKPAMRYQELYDRSVRTRMEGFAFTLFATDSIIPRRVDDRCMAIQHGIGWDVPRQNTGRSLRRQFVAKAWLAYATVRRIHKMKRVVCVDYNFSNWYRTQVDTPENRLVVIPNYAHISEQAEKPDASVNVIFARRLFDYRGTRVFTEAIKPLLEKYTNMNVTVAGSGPDEQWMREQLSDCDRVRFIQYAAQQSEEIHRDMHIALVPTIGSEGTSLSLLEAMAAGCAVICTDVGGMTQIVMDGYNGRMVPAGDVDSLRAALEELVADEDLRRQLATVGYETVRGAYSYERWRDQWKTVLRAGLS